MKKLTALLLVVVLALGALASCKEVDHKTKGEGVMTYAQYDAAALDSEVVIEAYVQATQGWWFDTEENRGKLTAYLADLDGAYFAYEMHCASQEEADKLTRGTKIKLTGYKAEWAGEVEIVEGHYEIIEFEPLAMAAEDVTSLIGNKDELLKRQNKLIAIKGATVKEAAIYNWDGTGSLGSDLYLKLTVGEKDITVVVESYLHGKDTDVYKTVDDLKVGDKVDVEAFLYWYEGAQPHVNKVTVK